MVLLTLLASMRGDGFAKPPLGLGLGLGFRVLELVLNQRKKILHPAGIYMIYSCGRGE